MPPMAHFGGAQRVLTPTNTYIAATIDAAGNLYATQGSTVLKYTLSSGSYSAPVTIYTAPTNIGGDNMTVGADGSVYVVTGAKFFRLTPDGGSYTPTITTTDMEVIDGVAVDSANNVYVTGYNESKIEIYTPSPSGYTQTGQATSVSAPSVLTIDASGVIYVATGNGQSIVKLTPVSGGTYTSTSVASLSNPSGSLAFIFGIAVDPAGNVFYGTSSAMNIEFPGPGTPGALFEATPGSSGYTTSTLYTATNSIYQVTREADGNLLVADSTQGLVEVQQSVVDFGTVAIGASVTRTASFTFDSEGSLSNTTPYQVFLQGATGLDFVDAGTGSCNGTTVYEQGIICTVNVTFTPTFAGLHSGAVTLVDFNGNVVATAPLVGTGQGPQIAFGPGTFNEFFGNSNNGIENPGGVVVDGKGNVYIANSGGRTVSEIVAAGGVIPASPTFRTLGSTGSFTDPTALAIDGSGNIYVSDYSAHSVKEIVAVNGVIPDSPTIRTLASGFGNPWGVAVDATGNVYMADASSNVVKEIVAVNGVIPSSPVINTLGSGFTSPRGVAVDSSGNVYVSDAGNNAVKEIVAVNGAIPSSPTINTLGSGFSSPEGLFLDANGDLYVVDANNNVVKEIMAVNGVIPSSPIINTVDTDFSVLSGPSGVAVDGKGSIYIADTDNSALEILDRYDPPTIELSNDIGTPNTQVLTIWNIGNADLHFPPLSSATNPSITSGFTWDGTGSGACPQISSSSSPGVLSAGASCTIPISFTPASADSVTGTLMLTDDTLNVTTSGVGSATQNISLVGTGNAISPTITFTVPNHNFGDAPFTVSATSNSNGAFTYTVTSGPATISGSTVTLTGLGTVMLKATQAADGNYRSLSKKISFTVSAATPTITFAVPDHTVGDAPFTVGATSNSTGAFTYTVVSGPATISGTTVTVTGTGTVVLQTSEAADSDYAAGMQNATFNVTATITPTITFAVPNHTVGDAPFTVGATSNSTGAFTYSVVSGPATISGATVTVTGAGTVVLQASQAANGNYAAKTATASFTVTATGPVVPTLTFAPIAAQTFGAAPFTVSATSASSGAVTYAVVSGPATISGATVTLTGAGTVVLSANQAASGNYAAATATTSFVVNSGFTLAVGSGAGSTGTSATATVAPGAAATFPLTFSLGGAATFPDALNLSASGLPPGATATFSPATIPAGSAATPVTLTIQTSVQTAHNEKPFTGGPLAPIALGFLLLPLAGMKTVRRRLRQIPQLTMALAITLSLGVVLGLSGCGGKTPVVNQPATSYTVAVTATDTVTGAHSSVNVTLNVQ